MSQSRQPQQGHRLLVRVFVRDCGSGGVHSEYRGSVWLLLFLLSVYLLTFDGMLRVTDGQAMFAVAENLAKHGSPDARQLDNWEDLHVGVNGLPYAKYPLGPSLAMLPLYGLGLLGGGRIGLAQTALLLPALATALTGGLVVLIARGLGYAPRAAMCVGLLYGLATIAWVYTRDMWSEPLGGLSLATAFYAALRYRQRPGGRWLLLLGVATGLAVLMKTVNVFLVPLLLFYAFDLFPLNRVHWVDVLLFGATVALVVASIGAYNWVRFGDLLDSGYDADEVFSTPLWQGGGGLLFSPQKGLFWFNPILVVAIGSGIAFWKRHRRESLLVLGILLVHVAIFGAWWAWWGGESWGPRFLVPVLPLVVLYLLPVLIQGSARWFVGIIIGLSVAAQVIGLISSDTYLVGWSDETFSSWFLPTNWAPFKWPFVGHLLEFDAREMGFAWLWWGQGGTRHFYGWLLGLLLLNVLITGTGLVIHHRGSRRLPVWTGVGLSMVTMALLLGRIAPDPRYIKKLPDARPHQAAYDTLLAQLSPGATLILTDKRFEPYFFNHHTASNAWYTLAKPRHRETLATVSHLLEREGGTVALIADDQDNTLLPYAIEQWLAQRSSLLSRQTFGAKVQMTVFQLLPSETGRLPIPATPVFDYTADPETARFQGIASLLGWDVVEEEAPRLSFTVYWINLGKC